MSGALIIGILNNALNLMDVSAAKTAVREAEAQKVPVLTLDRSAKGITITSHIASDNV